jgi:hypothetical protein
MKKCFILFILFLGLNQLWGQEAIQDTTTLLYYMKSGKSYGQIRNYLMATNNQKPLTDYYANALGVHLAYETAKWKGLKLGMEGSFVAKTWASDLTRPDSLTGQFSRYEIGLFDITHPNKALINSLDKLYLSYEIAKTQIILGKQKLITPWLNPQDGRMRPNFQDGIYLKTEEIKNLKIETAWIYGFLVRSTDNWLTLAQSIGQYPAGVTPDGLRSGYSNNLKSAGLLILSFTYEPIKPLNLQVWNYFVENIFNTTMSQAEANLSHKSHSYFVGFQWHYQTALNDGGNPDPNLAYIPKNQTNWAVSSRVGWKNKQSQITLNYTRIGKQGRFLFPREWGKDPFYTFLPLERNEGYGDVHSFMGQAEHTFSKLNLKIDVGYGHYYLPDVRNTFLNKYGFPSYNQLNLNLVYAHKGFLKGLQSRLMLVHKSALADTYENLRFVFNKVNMTSYNLIFTYSWQ